MNILQPARTEEDTEYFLVYVTTDDAGAGFQFPCDATGIPDLAGRPVAQANYEACCRGAVHGRRVEFVGLLEHVQYRRIPAEGRCTCGRLVVLEGFTNTCDCGRDYDSSGQELAPREQWGEETGESLSDILRL
ncbi:hypothetical protein C4901_09110 [Acidiferrobacter sp. SPIII_3]|uniref:hypothetical protein n=1 Tax=Acidiferrobacter sp. SPIII_3 TaxID=1281578 RepID=UPI000D73D1F5|nr:hypothetical protein [Acidiferrobacter sp. SPIII_3]AWP23470.1 hypothetical protein C4901_09110 [Acidiferrobacter sp. SPIII_3]